MIQVNGTSVNFTKADGTLGTVSMAQWEAYVAVLAVSDRQKDAERINTQAHGNYLTLLVTYQINIGRPNAPLAPVKPKALQVSDEGVETWVDFVPALPDPVIPVASTPAPSAGNLVTLAGTPDAVHQALLGGLVSVGNKLDALAAALKAKGII